MEDAVIVSAVRTPVGSFGGLRSRTSPRTELGAHAIQGGARARRRVPGDEVDEVILGCVLQAGLGQNPARQAAMGAGIPKEVPATTINMLCGSGLKSVALAVADDPGGRRRRRRRGRHGEHDARAVPDARRPASAPAWATPR